MISVTIEVPATTANLGSGFDCLALALDLWNEVNLTVTGNRIRFFINGEGSDVLHDGEQNLLYRSFLHLYNKQSLIPPEGLEIHCKNNIPLKSGLGSSSAAILAGLAAANALLGFQLSSTEILQEAVILDGHPDNVAAALYGSLVLSYTDVNGMFQTYPFSVHPYHLLYVLPDIDLTTTQARSILPGYVSRQDAVYNLSRICLLVEGLRNGDYGLLAEGTQDRLHQPIRLENYPLIHGAFEVGKQAGASAITLSGAGPGIIVFSLAHHKDIQLAIESWFKENGVKSRSWMLAGSQQGMTVKIQDS